MNDRETARYNMFSTAQTFGKNNAPDFAAGGEALKRFASLTTTITQLDREKAQQRTGTHTAKEVLLDALRLDLQNITRTASAIAQDQPGFADTFRPPETSGQGKLLTNADTFLAQLQEAPTDSAAEKAAKATVVAQFIAHELPTDFVLHLAEDIQAIHDAKDHAAGDENQSVESTAAVGRLIREGMKEITYLDAILRNKYTRTPDKLRAWESASHIERAPQREKKPAPTPTP